MSEAGDCTKKQTVLLVDDSPENLAILSSLLRGQYRIKVATNGATALEIACSDQEPDLILLDITMPDMDGYEVCRRLKGKEKLRDIPIIFLSALNETVDKVRAFSAGGIDYVTKPFHAEEVKARVQTHLKIRRLQIELEKQNGTLQQYNEQLNRLHGLKDEFLRIASHDLKNPLTCIMGFAGIIDSSTPSGEPMTEEARNWLGKITSQCLVMQKIIEDFLDFQAMEDGQMKLTREPTDLDELARDVVQRNAVCAAKKHITTELDLEEGLPILDADLSRICQVFENYVGNAIKFCPEGEHIKVSIRTHNDGVLVEVCDSGPGLTDDDMKKVFMKYSKLSNAPTGGEKSSGLGLAICKKIIELHGGTTGARSNETGGATFWFELPCKPLPTNSNVSRQRTSALCPDERS